MQLQIKTIFNFLLISGKYGNILEKVALLRFQHALENILWEE